MMSDATEKRPLQNDDSEPKQESKRHNPGATRNTGDDIHVHLQSSIVPINGREKMDVLLSVPGAEKSVDDGGVDLSGEADLMVAFDGSGSMYRDVELLKKAAIKMADDESKLRDPPVKLSFAYAQFGSSIVIPSDGVTGYTKWMPLADTKVAMRNVTGTLNANMGGTNMKLALKEVVRECNVRRDEEERRLPHLQHVLLMTDGAASDGCAITIPQMLKEEIGDNSVVVHVLALGDRVNMPLCEAIAQVTHGVVAHAIDATALNDAFESILCNVRSSSKPFTVQLVDKGGNERIQHFGILNRMNNTALTNLSFGAKTSPGCHMGATVGLYMAKTSPTAVMPLYAEDDDAVWTSERAKEPKALTHALETNRLLAEHRKKVEEAAETQGFAAAMELSSQLATRYANQDVGPVALNRINAFHQELERTITAQTNHGLASSSSSPPDTSRSMTIAAVGSRSAFSQSY